MIVVADTSPLNYLVILGAIDVLPGLFNEVHARWASCKNFSILAPRTQ